MTHILIVFMFALVLSGCDRPHPAGEVTQQFSEALRYGDRDQLFTSHIDSTEQSQWCREKFKALLARAQQEARSEDCQRVRSLTSTDLAAMTDELRLAVQVTGWSCQHPRGTCVDYGRTVFEQALDEHPLVTHKPTAIEVKRVFGDDRAAAAYLDVTDANGALEHRALQLQNVEGNWRISEGFLTR